MKRLHLLGWMVISGGSLLAADPQKYTTAPVPSGTLSQSLPSAISGVMPTPQIVTPAPAATAPTIPPPAMVSTTTWNQNASYLPAPACAQPRFRAVPTACETGVGPRGSLLERFREWLCGGSGPALAPGFRWPTPGAPLSAYNNTHWYNPGQNVSGAYPSKCETRGGQVLPMNRIGNGRVMGSVGLGRMTGASCDATAAPQPIAIAMPTVYNRVPMAYNEASEPGFFQRICSRILPESGTSGLYRRPVSLFGSVCPGSSCKLVPGMSPIGANEIADGYHFANNAPPVTPTRIMNQTIVATPAPAPTPVLTQTSASQPFTVQR